MKQHLRLILSILVLVQFILLCHTACAGPRNADAPFLESEIIFPLEAWHNHASCIVETPNGDLLVCWFHGSGERTADDVKIEGARKRKGAKKWSPRFTMADTPGYPDTNCTMFIDPEGRLWLLWPTILANRWETALMKYRISSEYRRDGPPRWEVSEVLHLTPGPEFATTISNYVEKVRAMPSALTVPEEMRDRVSGYLQNLLTQAGDKLSRRLGWMTRAHPFILDGQRLIVPLYSDGFDCSHGHHGRLGQSWHTTLPLVGWQHPAQHRAPQGRLLYTLMRDNGPPPKRLHQSESVAVKREQAPTATFPIPGRARITSLRNGHWVLISSDTERRHSLAVQILRRRPDLKWKRTEFNQPGLSRLIPLSEHHQQRTARCTPATVIISRS
jgi:hypothetical protein